MIQKIANRVLSAALVLVVMTACASVRDTSRYYVALTPKVFPPKPADAEIPILEDFPVEKYTVIGEMKFESAQSWAFLRRSLLYHARMHGADAVVVRPMTRRREVTWTEAPPHLDIVPVNNRNYYGNGQNVYGATSWVPVFRPGSVRPFVEDITGIDARMIVFPR